MQGEPVMLYDFLSGSVAFGFAVCALFFLRFWCRTRDSLFVGFALALDCWGWAKLCLRWPTSGRKQRRSTCSD